MISPKIISLGFAVPEKGYTQEEVFQVLGYPQRFWRVFKESGIAKRHLWLPPQMAIVADWQSLQEAYQAGAVQVSLQAVNECLDGRSVENIACVVYGSCTGFAPGPTVAHYLAKELGLEPSTYYTNIIGQGCESGFPGLRRAYDFAMATGKQALVVNCELCSCTYYPDPADRPDPTNHFELLRSNAIFGDAASCALVGFDEDPRHPYTEGLMASIPRLDYDTKKKLVPIEGQPPSVLHVPPGCSFHPRCRHAFERCRSETPELIPISEKHEAACWRNVE